MKLIEIENELSIQKDNPHQLAELRVLLSAKFATVTNQLTDILRQKPRIWNGMRADYKSDKATDRAWDASELGLREMELRATIRKIEKMMSAIKTMLDVLNAEARNLL